MIFSQNQARVWYFGNKAGLNMQSDVPSTIAGSQMNAFEGCASISDENGGSLLFYTDGVTVWNKNNDVMVNGTGLRGHYSSTQSALIIKQPFSKNLFYIFTTDEGRQYNWGVNYSIVDMNADNGNGVVIEKNHFLFGESVEQIAAIACQNNKEYWIAGTQLNTDTLFIFKLTAKGISSEVIKQNTGFIPSSFAGQIKFSERHLSIINYGANEVYIYDFDNATGKIANKRKISGFAVRVYGIEFSPNSNYLYISGSSYPSRLYQCEVDKVESNSICDSVCNLISTQPIFFGQLQLAPNKRIYLSGFKSSAFNDSAISVINYPDSIYSSCGFSFYTVDLNGRNPKYGLPNFPRSYVIKKPQEVVVKNYCLYDTTVIYINNSTSDSVLLDFDDGIKITTASTIINHRYNSSGSFMIKIYGYQNGAINDTIQYPLTIYNIKPPVLGKDTLLPVGDSIVFDIYDSSIEKYDWSTGFSGSTFVVKGSGTYSVSVQNKGCEAADTIKVKVIDNKYSVSKLCYNDTAQFNLSSTNTDSAEWDFGNGKKTVTTSTTVHHIFNDTGKYVVSCTLFSDGLSTTSKKEIRITKPLKPNLGNDTLICAGKGFIINAYSPRFTSYNWNTGSNDSAINVSKSGTYLLQIEENGCYETDSIFVKTINCGIVTKGFCLGDSTSFSLNEPSLDSVLWNFGDGKMFTTTHNAAKHFYKSKGNYLVKVIIYESGLIAESSTLISINSVPIPNLGSDTSLCINSPIKSGIHESNISFYWSDGSTGRETKAIHNGAYILTVEKEGCFAYDTVDISIINCDCDVFFPNAFTPNDNNLNEIFAPVTDCEIGGYGIQIFSQWGELIFESDNINKGWEGVYKDKPCPAGTYVWVAHYQAGYTGKKYNQKGLITLIR